MNVAESKIALINRIIDIEDESILRTIELMLDFEAGKGVFHLNAHQVARLEEAMKEVESGKLTASEEADREIDQWLSGR